MKKLEYIGGGQFAYGGENVGSDYNFPGVACDIGWSLMRVQRNLRLRRRPKLGSDLSDGRPVCEHMSTDGTIDCPDCGTTASQFIRAAEAYLQERAE